MALSWSLASLDPDWVENQHLREPRVGCDGRMGTRSKKLLPLARKRGRHLATGQSLGPSPSSDGLFGHQVLPLPQTCVIEAPRQVTLRLKLGVARARSRERPRSPSWEEAGLAPGFIRPSLGRRYHRCTRFYFISACQHVQPAPKSLGVTPGIPTTLERDRAPCEWQRTRPPARPSAGHTWGVCPFRHRES